MSLEQTNPQEEHNTDTLKNALPQSDLDKAQLVCDAMKHIPGWSKADPSQLTIKESNGYSGAKTFHVTAPQHYIPSQVCLHHRDDIKLLPRQLVVANAFSNEKVSPRVLAVERNFWIDEWVGIGTVELKSVDDWKECGHFLGKIHSIPTDWWQSTKAQYIKDQPVFATFPQGSLAWAYIQRDIWQILPKMDDSSQYKLATAITSDHPIAGRIVTSHSDYHPGNIIDLGKDSDGDRFKCIDFEFTCVTHAVQDLAFGIACCGTKNQYKEAFLTGYLMQLGYPVTQEAIRSLRIEAEIYQLTSWHSGGRLAPWCLQDLKAEQIMELVDEIQKFTKHVHSSTEAQEKLLKVRLETYVKTKGNNLYEYEEKKIIKNIQEADKEGEEFKTRLQDLKQSPQRKSLLEKAVWRQPEGAVHPLKIGTASELGMHSSFTALCWIKNDSQSRERRPIFMGDVDPEGSGKHWHDYKSKIMHLELRHENRFYFGFGWDDASSDRMCRFNKWDHVAYVYQSDGQSHKKTMIVNGKVTQNRWGNKSKAYEGDQTIWLGEGKHHGIGEWIGKLKGGMIFKQALTEMEVSEIAAATNPMREL